MTLLITFFLSVTKLKLNAKLTHFVTHRNLIWSYVMEKKKEKTKYFYWFKLESDADKDRGKYLLHQHNFWRTRLRLIDIWQLCGTWMHEAYGIASVPPTTHLTHASSGVPHSLSRRHSTQAVFCYPEHKGFLHHVQTLIFLSCGTFSLSPVGTCQSPTGSW